MERLSVNDYYLNIAKAVSARSTCLRRQYGAVIVNKGEIIATGYNGGVRGGINCSDHKKCVRMNKPHNSGDYSDCHAVHAEQNAIISASRRDMLGGDLYLFGCENSIDICDIKPCPICMKLIINAGINRIITKDKIFDLKGDLNEY